jgi:cell division protein FtsI/penicillin-binding protein 2
MIGAAGALVAIGGAVLIASHARKLAAAGDTPGAAQPFGAPRSIEQFQSVLPGIAFTVPEHGGISLTPHAGGALLVAAGVRSAPPVRIDLCSQTVGGRLLPVRIAYNFDDVARWVAASAAANRPAALHNVVLSGTEDLEVPRVQVSGNAGSADEPLQLRWESRGGQVSWIGDAGYGQLEQGPRGQVALRRDGWLVWRPDAAMHIQRRASAACPQAGELVVQMVRSVPAATASKAQVIAYPANGEPVTAWLAAGRYDVPSLIGRALEDQALFLELRARGMLRLGATGLAELVPRDLAAWRTAPEMARAAALASWDNVTLDPPGVHLLRRLYRMADGQFLREQVRVFNAERRLLAWRAAPGGAVGSWQATVDSAPAPLTGAMPVASARLFASVEPGWLPWTRIESWPEASPSAPARLTMSLARPARAGELVHLMLIGSFMNTAGAVQGASIRSAANACTGRSCPSPHAVQLVVLELMQGARSVSIDATPLDMSPLSMPGDQQYRQLRVTAGQLEWQPLAAAAAAPRPAPAADVTLEDRNGITLWSGGAPTQAALDAGLAPLLGIRADHASSIAGMLARLPSPTGSPHAARLTLDLALQASSQGALSCIGMRRGQWDGKTCSGGHVPPPGRHAGIVILDTETGDVLAAAGMGGAPVNAANWNEVRNFDRSDPARSPLRLPAFQHDGGAHSSPGSTFKIISAMGLEQAALRDPQLEALLAGMPLPAINRMAHEKGFGFRTDSPSYPVATRLAHITNYKDQHLDRRAQDGKLGLSQALTYSLNTWFAWSGELSDRSLFGRPEGGAPDLQPLEAGALDSVRPIVAMAHRLGFGQALRLDGGLLPPEFSWSAWDALQASAANIDPIHTRHELRQMSIGLRMQVTPLQMALAAGAVGQGAIITPRLLLSLDRREAKAPAMPPLGVRLDRIRAGMKGVIDTGTAAGAFRTARFDTLRRGLSGKTGTAPTGPEGNGALATVWFTCWLEPGSLPGQKHRLAVAAFVSHSEVTGGEHAAPIVAAVLASSLEQNQEQRGK